MPPKRKRCPNGQKKTCVKYECKPKPKKEEKKSPPKKSPPKKSPTPMKAKSPSPPKEKPIRGTVKTPKNVSDDFKRGTGKSPQKKGAKYFDPDDNMIGEHVYTTSGGRDNEMINYNPPVLSKNYGGGLYRATYKAGRKNEEHTYIQYTKKQMAEGNFNFRSKQQRWSP